MKKMLAILLIVALALPLTVFTFANEVQELPTYGGSVFFNGVRQTAFENAPLSVKGDLYIALEETAKLKEVTVNVEQFTKVEEFNEVTYVTAKEFAQVTGLYFYENKLNDQAYLMDNSVALVDGVYKVASTPQGNAADIGYLSLTVEGGKITAVTFDEQRGTGEWKFGAGNSEYTTRWANSRNLEPGTPDVLKANIIETLIANQTAYGMNVDVFTGATSSFKKIHELSNAAIAKAKVQTIQHAAPKAYRDGKYEVVGLENNGYTPVLKMSVANGKITSVFYDEINAEGVGKRGSDYMTRWANARGVDAEAIIANAEAQLVYNQDPALVDTLTGATSVGKNMLMMAAAALDQAARLDFEVEAPAYNDGLYWVRGEEARGYIPVLKVRIVDGEISVVELHDVSTTTGLSKRYNSEYLTNWGDRFEIKPLEILIDMEAYVIENQSFDIDVDVSTGATRWAEAIEELGQAALVNSSQETIYVFVGNSQGSAYRRQFLAVEQAGEILAIDYLEYQNSNYIPKMHNTGYVGPDARWVESRADELGGRLPLEILEEIMGMLWENKSVEGIDSITGATNWLDGINKLAPSAFELVK
ncbi:FMN-binding protein [Alkaliphilus transvaalensis]|uniref:FMN-binding protein n=1 Tax=Alkaliphilus transvaalensis TaxID=114628 RepID=UPI00047CFDF7|nr:FMN-binding protein [Alkaliphilus transvaalensis]